MDLQNILDRWKIKCDIGTILGMWNESHRSYHTLDHLNDLLDQADENRERFDQKEYEMLVLASLFHDAVYEPANADNEERSADFFMSCCEDKSNPDILAIRQMILDTKDHKASSRLSKIFSEFDMRIVERDLDSLLEWEKGISEEYSMYPKEQYKEGRLKFLESLLDKYPANSENLLGLIGFVKNS